MEPTPTSAALSVLALGFLLGLRHATDADHVVAVATIVARERRVWSSSRIGVLWGVGHTLTLLLVGGAIVLCKWAIPARVGLGMELGVAAMLLVLGVLNVVGATGLHSHEPREVGACSHEPREVGACSHEPPPRGAPVRGILRPLAIGVVHGLAGSAAIALLVLSTIGDSRWAFAYLAIFGAGTIAGMGLLTTAMALPMAYATRPFATLNRALVRATGLASVAFGLALTYELIAVQGLLSSAPHWVPS